MKCVRCGMDFPTSVPEHNVRTYTGSVVYTCPHCNKAYRFISKVSVEVAPIDDSWITPNCNDDWGRKIIKDSDYEEY